MDLNEIKKALYKQKPEAKLLHIRKGKVCYFTYIGEEPFSRIDFEVPIEDMGDSSFYDSMNAQLLIRWIVKE